MGLGDLSRLRGVGAVRGVVASVPVGQPNSVSQICVAPSPWAIMIECSLGR